jgi:hypothetical protein
VKITVINLRRGAKGEHIVEYNVHDPRAWYLASSNGTGGGFTRSSSRSQGSCIDPEAPYDKEQAQQYAEQVAPANEERQKKKLGETDPRKKERRVKDFLQAVLKDLDTPEKLAVLEEFEARLREVQGR